MAFAARKQFLERARTRQSPADFSEITHEEIENEFDSYTTNQITMLAESTTSSEKLFQFLRTTKPSKENLSSLQIRRELDGGRAARTESSSYGATQHARKQADRAQLLSDETRAR